MFFKLLYQVFILAYGRVTICLTIFNILDLVSIFFPFAWAFPSLHSDAFAQFWLMMIWMVCQVEGHHRLNIFKRYRFKLNWWLTFHVLFSSAVLVNGKAKLLWRYNIFSQTETYTTFVVVWINDRGKIAVYYLGVSCAESYLTPFEGHLILAQGRHSWYLFVGNLWPFLV